MITVIGKLRDVEQYRGRAGYNVMPLTDDWSPEANRAWIDAALQRGDQLLLASWEVTGEYRNELIYILRRLTEVPTTMTNDDACTDKLSHVNLPRGPVSHAAGNDFDKASCS